MLPYVLALMLWLLLQAHNYGFPYVACALSALAAMVSCLPVDCAFIAVALL
jgi:hypothetical protein